MFYGLVVLLTGGVGLYVILIIADAAIAVLVFLSWAVGGAGLLAVLCSTGRPADEIEQDEHVEVIHVGVVPSNTLAGGAYSNKTDGA